MTKRRLTKLLLLAGCGSLTGVGTVLAGGIERGGHNIDLLFDPSGFVGETAYTFVMPQRDLDVEPQHVVPGQSEATDRCFGL